MNKKNTNNAPASDRRPLAIFFTLAFAISWVFWIPAALASHGSIPLRGNPTLGSLLGAFGPFFAALLTVTTFEGRSGLIALFKRLLIWRVGIVWYVFVLCWPVLLSLAKTGLAVLLGSALPDFSEPPFVKLYPLPPELLATTPFLVFLPFVFLQQTLIGSSMGEEIGWRGYALPQLQSKTDSLRASLLLGFLWGIWHVPFWLTRGNAMQGIFPGWAVLGLMATTILYTWVYNHTRGSLLLALLFHSSIAVSGLFLASAEAHPLIEVVLSWIVAILVIGGITPKRSSREA